MAAGEPSERIVDGAVGRIKLISYTVLAFERC